MAKANRYVNSLAIDPANASHVYAVFGGFSRRWIPAAGVGHVFESNDAGATWTDISGALPDAPADDLVIKGTTLYLGTDVGTFTASAATPSVWSRLGSGLPNAAVNDLSPTSTAATSSRPRTAGASGRSRSRSSLPTEYGRGPVA